MNGLTKNRSISRRYHPGYLIFAETTKFTNCLFQSRLEHTIAALG